MKNMNNKSFVNSSFKFWQRDQFNKHPRSYKSCLESSFTNSYLARSIFVDTRDPFGFLTHQKGQFNHIHCFFPVHCKATFVLGHDVGLHCLTLAHTVALKSLCCYIEWIFHWERPYGYVHSSAAQIQLRRYGATRYAYGHSACRAAFTAGVTPVTNKRPL